MRSFTQLNGLVGPMARANVDLFYNNCFKNGILPIIADAKTVARLFEQTAQTEGYRLDVDLAAQTVTTPSGEVITFEVDELRQHCLLNGLDDIELTLQNAADIRAFEDKAKAQSPWLFAALA
jgi:3-isopropylmalate/(R)-2-methylmalate dehydratase small subunit